MKRLDGIPLARLKETCARLTAPHRAAYKTGAGLFSDYTIHIWPNRASLARSIRMQQRRAAHASDWHAIIPLSDSEGY